MKENAVVEKSFEFAVRIVNLYKYMVREQKEFVLSKQLLRCGTSIGANVSEAQRGQSKADFAAKLCIQENNFAFCILHYAFTGRKTLCN
ncbi:MAG: four helix bundle protein [Oscillospiraceae bacterium]|nr:four helix bundle protein [Oscillospiraceae bacterium]